MRSTASIAWSTITPPSRRVRSSGNRVTLIRRLIALFLSAAIATGAAAIPASLAADTETKLTLAPDDVIPTGNDWIALPSIRAGDAALMDFNVISMRYRGLIEFAGTAGQPLIKPFLSVGGF